MHCCDLRHGRMHASVGFLWSGRDCWWGWSWSSALSCCRLWLSWIHATPSGGSRRQLFDRIEALVIIAACSRRNGVNAVPTVRDLTPGAAAAPALSSLPENQVKNTVHNGVGTTVLVGTELLGHALEAVDAVEVPNLLGIQLHVDNEIAVL
jgi:hypothetical protein